MEDYPRGERRRTLPAALLPFRPSVLLPFPWARLIAKVYEIDPLVCPRCSCRMRILAVITAPAEVNKILRHLVKIGRPPLERQQCAQRAAGASRPESRVAELTLLSRSSVLSGERSALRPSANYRTCLKRGFFTRLA